MGDDASRPSALNLAALDPPGEITARVGDDLWTKGVNCELGDMETLRFLLCLTFQVCWCQRRVASAYIQPPAHVDCSSCSQT